MTRPIEGEGIPRPINVWYRKLFHNFPLDGKGEKHIEWIDGLQDLLGAKDCGFRIRFIRDHKIYVYMGRNLEEAIDEWGVFGDMAEETIDVIKDRYKNKTLSTKHKKLEDALNGPHFIYSLTPEVLLRVPLNTTDAAGLQPTKTIGVDVPDKMTKRKAYILPSIENVTLGQMGVEGICDSLSELCDQNDHMIVQDHNFGHSNNEMSIEIRMVSQ